MSSCQTWTARSRDGFGKAPWNVMPAFHNVVSVSHPVLGYLPYLRHMTFSVFAMPLSEQSRLPKASNRHPSALFPKLAAVGLVQA